MAPLLTHIIEDIGLEHISILVHPISENLFAKYNLPYDRLSDAITTPPLSGNTWNHYLQGEHIRKIFCTTSSPYRDVTNGALIETAGALSIPVMGIMDHWKGFDRFLRQGHLTLPDHICCIDENSAQKFSAMGVLSGHVHVVGHPYLEQIGKQRWNRREDGTIRILLVSQPVVSDKSFEGIFFRPYQGKRLIDEISRVLEAYQMRYTKPIRLCLRPHPKEVDPFSGALDAEIDNNERWEESLRENDVFVGVDSLALVEARLAGKHTISLVSKDFNSDDEHGLTIPFLERVTSVPELLATIGRVVKELNEGNPVSNERIDVFEGSTKRALNAVYAFLE